MPNCTTHSLLLWNSRQRDSNEIKQAFENKILEFVRAAVTYSHVDSESRHFILKLNLKLIYQTPPKYTFNIMCHISNINK